MMALETSSSGGRARSTRPLDLLMACFLSIASQNGQHQVTPSTNESVGSTLPTQRIRLWAPPYSGRIPSTKTHLRHSPAPISTELEDAMSRVWRPPPSPLSQGLQLPDLSRRGLLRG